MVSDVKPAKPGVGQRGRSTLTLVTR
jgi:hypothetical protein